MDKGTCSHVDGCDQPVLACGLCDRHYRQKLDKRSKKCSHPGCDKPFRAKGLCRKHYRERQIATLAQQKCKNDLCDNPRGESNGYCPGCYHRSREYGDPNAGPPRRKRRRGSKKVGKRTAYHVNHAMVRKERGPAWNHGCEHCGGQGQTWAMKHGTTGESPDDYMPLCWVCHAKYDNFVTRLPDNRGSKRTAEQRARMSRIQTERYKDPAVREVARAAALRREARKREAREAKSVADLVLFDDLAEAATSGGRQ